MSGRIYPEELYIKEIERLKLKYYFCPHCFGNDIANKVGSLQLFVSYHCNGCKQSFIHSEALTKDKVREIKINSILNGRI